MSEYMIMANTVSKMAIEDGITMEIIVVDTDDKFVMAIHNEDGEILYLNETQFREYISDRAEDY